MFSIQNFIIIILILYLLNYVKYKDNILINQDLYTELKKPIKTNIFTGKNNIIFGKDQYNIVPMYIPDKKYKFQNIDFLKENNKFELTDKLDFTYDKNKLLTNFHNESKKGVVTAGYIPESLIEQKTMYDYKFEDVDVKEILNTTDFKNNTINEVYNNLIVDYKKLNQAKTPIKNNAKSDTISGAFNESSYKGNIQEYEEDDYGNAYDPSQSLLLAL